MSTLAMDALKLQTALKAFNVGTEVRGAVVAVAEWREG